MLPVLLNIVIPAGFAKPLVVLAVIANDESLIPSGSRIRLVTYSGNGNCAALLRASPRIS